MSFRASHRSRSCWWLWDEPQASQSYGVLFFLLALLAFFSFANFLKLIDKNEFSYLWLRIVSPFSDFFVSITFFGNTYLSFLSSLISPWSSLIVSNLSSLISRIVFTSIVLLSDIIVMLQRKSFFDIEVSLKWVLVKVC